MFKWGNNQRMHSRIAFRRANAGDVHFDWVWVKQQEQITRTVLVCDHGEIDLTCPDRLGQRGSRGRSWHLGDTLSLARGASWQIAELPPPWSRGPASWGVAFQCTQCHSTEPCFLGWMYTWKSFSGGFQKLQGSTRWVDKPKEGEDAVLCMAKWGAGTRLFSWSLWTCPSPVEGVRLNSALPKAIETEDFLVGFVYYKQRGHLFLNAFSLVKP